jgi:fucose permease
LILAEISVLLSYAIIACPVPFPVVVVAYTGIGFGEAISIALNNVFIANLANSTVLLGAAHGSYGVGGILGPIMATAMVSTGIHWSRFFAVAISFRIVNLFAVWWAFRGYEKEGGNQFSNALQQVASTQTAVEEGEPSKLKAIARALKNKTTLIGAVFIFAYVNS